MNILPPSQINNMPILEEVLEELRLSILENIQYVYDSLNLYSLSSEEIKKKLNLLGLVSITIGKFIKISLNDKEFEYISPAFYKAYRKLNQHRGNKMSMDYILHSGGMMNTLVHSNQQFYRGDLFSDAANFFEFNTFRDNQISDLGIGDGYILVPYSSNRSQILKQYLATNPIIFDFLPAGYTFIFLSEYRNSYNNGVFQYDNFLNLFNDTKDVKKNEDLDNYIDPDIHNIVRNNYYWEDFDLGIENYIKPRYWERMNDYETEEVVLLPDESEFTVTHNLHYYEPIAPPWRDSGLHLNVVEYPRFTYDPTYGLQLFGDFEGYKPKQGDDNIPYAYEYDDRYPIGYQYKNLTEYLEEYNSSLSNEVFLLWSEGLEANLNNTLNYRDVWLGDYLLSTLQGSNVYSEFYDHVKGLIAPFNVSSSPASLYNRGETPASQYWQREDKVVSVLDHDIQINKKEIITDRKEVDLFKFKFSTDRSIRLDGFYSESIAREVLHRVFGLDNYALDNILANLYDPTKEAIIIDGLDVDSGEADSYFESVISEMHLLENQYCNDIIITILDGNHNTVRTNDARYTEETSRFPRNVHAEETEDNNNILNQNTQKVVIDVTVDASGVAGTETLYQG